MKTIDLTPTWSEILPTLLIILRDASPKGQSSAVEELKNMARAADMWNEHVKKSESK